MIAPELITSDESIRLIEPDIERDAPLGVEWLSGENGRESLRLMGLPDSKIHPPTLQEEQERVQSFIDNNDELVWMIEVDGDVVGAVEVKLNDTEFLPAPALVIFIGDRSVRKMGVATIVLRAVIGWLIQEQEVDIIFARYRTFNAASAQLFLKLDFEEDGPPYTDKDGLHWQNVILRQEETL